MASHSSGEKALGLESLPDEKRCFRLVITDETLIAFDLQAPDDETIYRHRSCRWRHHAQRLRRDEDRLAGGGCKPKERGDA